MTELCVFVERKKTSLETFLLRQLPANVISMLLLTDNNNIKKDYQVNMMITGLMTISPGHSFIPRTLSVCDA